MSELTPDEVNAMKNFVIEKTNEFKKQFSSSTTSFFDSEILFKSNLIRCLIIDLKKLISNKRLNSFIESLKESE